MKDRKGIMHRGGKNIVLILEFGTRLGFVVNLTPQTPYLQERSPVTIRYSGEGAPELLWTFLEKRKYLPSTVI
jgi:hypothetical protein